MTGKVRYLFSGDCALIMEFGNEINPQINSRIRQVADLLEQAPIAGILGWIPTYRSILIKYNPFVISNHQLIDQLSGLEDIKDIKALSTPFVMEIPVVYGGAFGPDLAYVADHNNLSETEVIQIHSERNYLIYMMGFTPGFPYLGGMSERIATPRLISPREKITGGSVGIAGSQTGIYPIDSPGGWQLIGKTPIKLFEPEKEEPFLLKAGDYLRFVPVTEEEYSQIELQISLNQYAVKRFPLEVGEYHED
ncbi:MAG: 5-oxoprolinase subunit PxpB [Bacillota bacterium]|nr:5-oxoprolinase subunit PxpB [Bacillota bacterium]